MHNLERDLVDHLKMFQLPSLHHILEEARENIKEKKIDNKSEDPCEIDLDSENISTPSTFSPSASISHFLPLKFSHIGLGYLHFHPQLFPYFQAGLALPFTPLPQPLSPPSSSSPSLPPLSSDYFNFPDSSFIYKNIGRIIKDTFQDENGETIEELKEKFYQTFFTSLHSLLSISNITCLGVIIFCNPYELLDYFFYTSSSSSFSSSLRNSFLSRENEREEKKSEVKIIQRFSCPILKQPQNSSLLSSFLNIISSTLDLQPESFSPSLSKIRGAIESKLKTEVSEDGNPKTKKRKIPEEISLEMLIEASSEYAFLHYGSKKQVTKRYEDEENKEEEQLKEEQIDEEEINIDENIIIETREQIEMEKQIEIEEDKEKSDIQLDFNCYKPKLLEEEKVKNIRRSIKEPESIETFHPISSSSLSSSLTSSQYETIKGSLILKDSLFSTSLSSSSFFTISSSLMDSCHDLLEVISNEKIRKVLTQFPSLSSSDSFSIGKWGEALVYQYLVLERKFNPKIQEVVWVNEGEETKAAYDIRMKKKEKTRDKTIFIEVKSSKFDKKNSFTLSLWEWKFATELPKVNYQIYRVRNAGDPLKVDIVVIRDALELIERGGLKLCLVHPQNI